MSDVAYLLTLSVESDNIGNRIETISKKTKVYGTRKDVMSYEYYNAMAANNMKLEFGFEIWKSQYNNEEYIEYENDQYTVIRCLFNKKDKVTLIVQKRVDNFD